MIFIKFTFYRKGIKINSKPIGLNSKKPSILPNNESSSPKKGRLSTKFSSSKLIKENDQKLIKNVNNFDRIEELPEFSSFNSSMNSNNLNLKSK